MKSALALLLAFAVTACGGGREHGTATVWVTRDRGAQVLYTGTVPAGLTAAQALERVRTVTTRYGGRFVQSIDGIDGSATVQQTWDQIARIARQTAEAIELGRALEDDEIVLLDEWHAGTYGIPDEKTLDAIRLCARLEGVLTDPVYEGKSMAALIDLVRDGRIEPGSRVLYAHLGGQPALNAYAGAF